MAAALTQNVPLRVALLWNGALQAEQLLSSPRAVTLGAGPHALFALPEGVSSETELTLLAPDGGAFALQPTAGLGGFISIAGERQQASALSAPQRLGPSDYGVVTLGSVAVFFQHVQRAEAMTQAHGRRDGGLLGSLGLSIFLHTAVLVFLFFAAAREFAPSDELELDASLVKRFMVVPPPVDEKVLQRRAAAKEAEAQGMRERDERSAKKQEKAEGRTGKNDAPHENTRIAGEPKDAVATKVRGMGLLGVLSGGGATGSLHSALAMPSIDKMLGGMGAMQTVVGRGSGGYGLRGSGSGGGGTGQGALFGAGQLGTGIAAGGGEGRGRGQGRGQGAPGAKAKEAQLSLDNSGVKVRGFLSKEQIDRVVRANQAAIKYCFESEIQHQPKLSGAVHMNWRIDLQGHVTVARVAKTTLDNARVEGCMARQIKRWIFPKPDGGEVEVTYPFLLRGGG